MEDQKIRKFGKINFVFVAIICLLVGYIIGTSKHTVVYADAVDIPLLTDIVTALNTLDTQFSKLQNKFDLLRDLTSTDNQSQLKALAAISGNQKMLDKITSSTPSQIAAMQRSDFIKLCRNRIQDVISSVGKLTQQYHSGLTNDEKNRIIGTRNILADRDYSKNGIKTESERLGVLYGLTTAQYDDMQAKYGTTVFDKGKIQDQNLIKEKGSFGDFINYHQTMIATTENEIKNADDTSLFAQQQITNYLLIQLVQIELKKAEAEADANRMNAFSTTFNTLLQIKEQSDKLVKK